MLNTSFWPLTAQTQPMVQAALHLQSLPRPSLYCQPCSPTQHSASHIHLHAAAPTASSLLSGPSSCPFTWLSGSQIPGNSISRVGEGSSTLGQGPLYSLTAEGSSQNECTEDLFTCLSEGWVDLKQGPTGTAILAQSRAREVLLITST